MKKIKQAIILAGGKGTRLAEQTNFIPKPLVEIGNVPIIVHIINHLVFYGVEHVIIAGGYKVDLIKEYFMSDRYKYSGTISITDEGIDIDKNLSKKSIKKITIADTGLNTNTAQRIKKSIPYLEDKNEPFYLTYGDTVSNVNLDEVAKVFYKTNNAITLTAAQFQERFGILRINPDTNEVTKFAEKSVSTHEFINGGFMILQPGFDKLILEDDGDFSKDTIPRLQQEAKVSAYVHKDFWAAMDTQSDYEKLNKLYEKQPELFLR